MTDASAAASSDLPSPAGETPSAFFNESARHGVSYPTLRKLLTDATLALANAGNDLTVEDIKGLKKLIRAFNSLTNSQSTKPYYEEMKARIVGLTDPEAPTIGRDLVAAVEKTGCGIEVDEEMKNLMAIYVSYSYKKENRGFPNKVFLNPTIVDSEDDFASSAAHEFVHALQKAAAPALHMSPFNPDTRVIVHPEDWIMLEALCERDAYTKQAFINTLLGKDNPGMREGRKFDIVTPDEFDRARENNPSLADAVVTTALVSLSKPIKESEPNGRTFVNHYQDVALKNYAAGMAMRAREKETGFVFVRLELPDLWKVGDYGVGPNSFGDRVMEPLIAKRYPLLEDAKGVLREICETYKIPPLEECMTLREYHNSRAPETVLVEEPDTDTAINFKAAVEANALSHTGARSVMPPNAAQLHPVTP